MRFAEQKLIPGISKIQELVMSFQHLSLFISFVNVPYTQLILVFFSLLALTVLIPQKINERYFTLPFEIQI